MYEVLESCSIYLDILSDQNQNCSYCQQFWSENVQCPTAISSPVLGLHVIRLYLIDFLFDYWIWSNCNCTYVGYAVAVGHITSNTELGMLQIFK